MRKALILLAIVSLAGCNLRASVTEDAPVTETIEPMVLPAGFEGESTMLACNLATNECNRVSVIGNGQTIERMRTLDGGWTMIVEGECRDGYCAVTDDRGMQWKLEP